MQAGCGEDDARDQHMPWRNERIWKKGCHVPKAETEGCMDPAQICGKFINHKTLKEVLHLWTLFLKILCIFSKNKATLDKVSNGSD